MIHWRYVLPRALVVVMIVITARYVLSPIVGYLTLRSLQARAGIDADLDRVDVGLFPPRLHYHNLHVARASGASTAVPSAAAQTVELILDGGALMRRRVVIREARIGGLEMDLPSPSAPQPRPVEQHAVADTSPAVSWLGELLESAADAEKNALETLTANSEMLRRGDQIRRRWKNEYGSLVRRAAQLETELQEVQQSSPVIENPLRDRPRADAAARLLEDIQQELVSVRSALEQMPADFQSDLLTMERAKQADLQRVRECLPVDLAACEHLGGELLLRSAESQIQELRDYMAAGREVAQHVAALPHAPRQRGEVINLTPKKQLPSLVVRRCEVSGALRVAGQAYRLSGTLQNLTSQPRLQVEPMRAKLDLQGEQTIRLDYTRDDSSDAPHELLTIHWPELEAADLRLGAPAALDLDLCGGRAQRWVRLETHGQQVHGRLVSRRVGTQLQLHAPGRYGSTPLFTALKNSLNGLSRVEVDADFRGTWDDLNIAITTNLATALKTGLREAVAEQRDATRQKMDAQIDQLYSNELAELRQWVVVQQNQAAGEIAKVDGAVQDVSRELLSEVGAADFYLGRGRGSRSAIR